MSRKKDKNFATNDNSLVKNEESDVAGSRFQKDQDDAKAEDVIKKPGIENAENFVKKPSDNRGAVLKTEVASELLKDSKAPGVGGPNGGFAPGSFGLRSLAYSGDEGTLLGSASGTPHVGNSDRASSRFGRKLDAVNKKINYVASEQVYTHYDSPASLSESGSERQGYAGQPKNLSVRVQKRTGFSPKNFYYERSVDEAVRDQYVYNQGQVIKQIGVSYNDRPTKTYTWEDTSDHSKGKSYVDYTAVRGNYDNQYIDVSFTKSNEGTFLSEFKPHTEDYSTNNESYKVVNAANTNEIIDMNNAEMTRQLIDQNAGDEGKPGWSPLARVVKEPTATVGFLRDIEADTGAEIYNAIRFATKAFSYQLNKAAKDGQDIKRPLVEMCTLHLMNKGNGDYTNVNPFDAANRITADGDRKYMDITSVVRCFDSMNKFNTKADMLTQPRGPRLAFQTAFSNIGPFKLKPEFAKAVNAKDDFSTINRGYDPQAPVCIADGFKNISTINYEEFMEFTRDTVDGGRIYTSKPFVYSYHDRNNTYEVKCGHPLLSAVAYFLEQHAQKMYESGVAKNNVVKFRIPLVHTTRSLSAWDWIVMHSLPAMQYDRTNTMRDVLRYEADFGYPFSDLISVKEALDEGRAQYGYTDYDSPLTVGIMKPGEALTWLLPELFWITAGHKDSLKLVHPWYFSDERYKAIPDKKHALKVSLDDECNHWLMPIIRSGYRLEGLQDFYDMSPEDVRLSYDGIVRSPLGETIDEAYVYKYSPNTEGVLVGVFDGSDNTALIKMMSTPREIGYSFTAPAGTICKINPEVESWSAIADFTAAYSSSKDQMRAASCPYVNSSYRFRMWRAYKGDQYSDFDEGELATTNTSIQVNVDRGQSFKQGWTEVWAINTIRTSGGALLGDDGNFKKNKDCQLHLYTRAEQIGLSTVEYALFNPSDNSQATSNVPKVRNTLVLHWATLQKLPMLVNPIDMATFLEGGAYFDDPFELLYLFNFAGFMDTDYNEFAYDRIMEVQNKGWMYNKDNQLEKSYLYK